MFPNDEKNNIWKIKYVQRISSHQQGVARKGGRENGGVKESQISGLSNCGLEPNAILIWAKWQS